MNTDKPWKIALILSIATVFYNILEGFVSIYFGVSDGSLSLFGFGLDSFVEVISGLGVWHMITRIRKNADSRDSFEKTALKITGAAFYLLTTGLVITAIYNVIVGNKPTTTVWGVIISVISISTMFILMSLKMKTGKALHSRAIIADANCTKTCIYLSIILLASSLLYEIFKVGYIDSIGALGIAYYAFTEGKEAFEKAEGKSECNCS